MLSGSGVDTEFSAHKREYLGNQEELRARELVVVQGEGVQACELAQLRRNRPCRKIAKSSSSKFCCLGPAPTPKFWHINVDISRTRTSYGPVSELDVMAR